MSRESKRRLNIIYEVCKYRKNRNAVDCFNDDCKEVKEEKIVSKTIRRRGDGKISTKEFETGNILVFCDTHEWRELFSTSQLDGIPMPERVTTVNDIIPHVESPEGTTVER